jgi:hypothetical protein
VSHENLDVHLRGMKQRIALLLLVTLQACNPFLTPIFERKATPLTSTPSQARVVWAIDNSGSMLLPINPSDPQCPAGCGTASNLCPANCPTRISELPAGVDLLEAELPSEVTQATAIFPIDPVCGSPTSVALNLSASDVKIQVRNLHPSGGTPTGNTLRMIADLAPLPQTETFVVLITDGLPNCNAANPNNVCMMNPTPEQLMACSCTTSTCAPASLCSNGCLDLGAVSASHLLVEREQRLMVIGYGNDLVSGLGPEVLSAMEVTVGAEGAMFVSTGSDFQRPAEVLGRDVKKSLRCTWWLPRQVTASDLTVRVSGNAIPAEQWRLVGTTEQRVVISGSACDSLLAGTDAPSIEWLPPAE